MLACDFLLTPLPPRSAWRCSGSWTSARDVLGTRTPEHDRLAPKAPTSSRSSLSLAFGTFDSASMSEAWHAPATLALCAPAVRAMVLPTVNAPAGGGATQARRRIPVQTAMKQTRAAVASVVAAIAVTSIVSCTTATTSAPVLKLDRNWNIVAAIGFGQPGEPVFNAVHDMAVGPTDPCMSQRRVPSGS
jgi:hypothetical protein